MRNDEIVERLHEIDREVKEISKAISEYLKSLSTVKDFSEKKQLSEAIGRLQKKAKALIDEWDKLEELLQKA